MNQYHGRVWGDLPEDFPMKTLEKAYRDCIDCIGAGESSVKLMGMGFAGTAYRFRTVAENDEILSTSFRENGYGPPAEEYYRQITALYVFFSAGLSCIESFFFAMHALAAHYKPEKFKLGPQDLRNINYSSVKDKFNKYWEGTDLSIAMKDLVQSVEFSEWKDIRNIYSHRVVIPRETIFDCIKDRMSANLLMEAADPTKQNISLNEFTTAKRRAWLAAQMVSLVSAFDVFIRNN